MFDISDMTNPKEISSVTVGRRNSFSNLLYNPKELCFDREKSLLAFTVYTYGYNDYKNEYHQATQDAYVFRITGKTIALRGVVTQQTNGAQNQSRFAKRVIYIGDVLYTLSDAAVQANSLKTLKHISAAVY